MVIKTVSVSKPRPPRLPALLREVASPPGVAAQARRAAAAAPPPARSPTAVHPLKVAAGLRGWSIAGYHITPPSATTCHQYRGLFSDVLNLCYVKNKYCMYRAPHAPSAEVIVVRASTTNVARHRQDARLKRDAELKAGDVIDLGAPRLRRKPPVRKPGRAVPARPLYTPNPRLYPGPGTKPKSRPKRAEARGNDGRGRRHKRVYRRSVPNPRLYRPAPPRPPPPPAWPRTTWPSPTPPARLETASRVALRLNEQRPWTRAPQRPLRAAYLPVHTERSLVRAPYSPVRAVRSPVRAVPSPVRAVRSPVRAVPSPVRAVRSPLRVVPSPVRAVRSPVRAVPTPVRAFRSPVRPVRPPVRAVRSPVRAVSSPVRAVSSPVRAVRSPVRAVRSPVWAVRSPVRAARPPEQAERSPERAWCQLPPSPAHKSSASRRLVVTLPSPPAEPVPRYRPAGEHAQLRSLDTDSGASTPVAALAAVRAAPPAAAVPAMDAGNRQSTSPEDCSEGNETLSAPSEFLAEFLSAIMRHQYAEALKYCRLILQYEPHNATARGFYPLLQHKVQAHKRAEEGGWARGSSSEEASAHADKPQHAAPPGAQEMMEQGADESDGSAPTSRGASRSSSRSRGSCASQSSLELDSSDALAHSSPSLSLSRRTDSASAGCWESTGSGSRSEPDDNGNAPASLPACAADVQNDNAAPHKGESAASLRRLRAQFACSTK